MAQIAGAERTNAEPSAQAIRAQLARTRAELGRKLDMLKTHVLGDVIPSTQGDNETMAAKKSAKSKTTGRGARTASKKSPASRGRAKKSAGKKKSGVKPATARSATRSGKKQTARRSRSAPFVKKAKQVMGEVLAGAAAGAVAGALEAAIPLEQQEAARLHGHEAQPQWAADRAVPQD